MSLEQKTLNVTVSYGDVKVEFSGDPQAVLASVNSFLTKQIPALDLSYKITVNYSLNDLMEMFKDYVKITPEGPRVWRGEHKLSDKDIVGLQLVAAKINCEAGKASTPYLSLDEVKSATAINPKSISSRISEMAKSGYVDKEAGEQGTRYKITTQGIHWLNQTLMKKLKKSS